MTEQEFHNKREAFFIEFNGTITFINKGMSHEEYFKMVHHPEYIDEIIRGYLLEDHIILYVGKNFGIPMYINMEGISKLLNNDKIRGYNIKWIGLGCIKGEIGEEWEPQIKILPRNDS